VNPPVSLAEIGTPPQRYQRYRQMKIRQNP